MSESADTRRDDILISLCITDFTDTGQERRAVRELAADLARRYRYREILVIVTDDENDGDHSALLREVPHARIITVRYGTGFYRRRVIAASEAIGDVVALVSVGEVEALDVPAMIEAADKGMIVVGHRRGRSPIDLALRPLARAGGFRATAGAMLSAALPRTILNRLLARSDRELALRFPPRDAGLTLQLQEAKSGATMRRDLADTARRLGLIQKLVVNAAPRVLPLVGYLSLLVTVVAMLYAFYALVVYATFEQVQPGWLTTSLAVSATAAFLGVSLFGFATGLQRIIELLTPDIGDDVVAEVNAVDLFAEVREDLNVAQEIADDVAQEAPPDTIGNGSTGAAPRS